MSTVTRKLRAGCVRCRFAIVPEPWDDEAAASSHRAGRTPPWADPRVARRKLALADQDSIRKAPPIRPDEQAFFPGVTEELPLESNPNR